MVLNLFGDDNDVIRARIMAAAEAIGDNGVLLIDYAPRAAITPEPKPGLGLSIPIEDVITTLPVAVRSRVWLTNSKESYPWIRDSLFGWMSPADGKFQLGAAAKGNQSGVFSAPAIATLLNSCEDSSLVLPELRPVALQESMIENNDDGVCVVNSLVPDRIHAAGDDTLLSQLGCKKIIPAMNWQDWRNQGHTNGHIDLSVAFVSSKIAVIPALAKDCKTEFKTGWTELRDSLHAAGIETIEIPIALGCIVHAPDDIIIPPSRGGPSGGALESDFELNPRNAPTHALIGSYSNMVVLKDALLIPEFLPPNAYAAMTDSATCPQGWRNGLGCPVSASQELTEKYRASNLQAVSILEAAMAKGKIPRRKIISFPISYANAIGGGAVHCMTFQIPGSLNQCTQTHLDALLREASVKAIASSSALTTLPNDKLCGETQNSIATLNFMADKISDRELRSAASPADKIVVTSEMSVDLRESAQILEAARNKNCAKKP